MSNLWKQQGIPHKGWTLETVYDVRGNGQSEDETTYKTCMMCAHEKIRYVHVVSHPDFSNKLLVGCQCAEKLTDDYINPQRREKELRSKTSRRIRFIKRPWKIRAIFCNDKHKPLDLMKIVMYFLFIIISLSCSSHEGKEGIVLESAEAIVIKPGFSKNIVDIYPNLDTIKYVKLELSDSSIITEITKIEVYDSLLYVLDAKASTLFVFDMDGKYHFKIHSIGQGPKEFTQLDFFSIDRDLKQIVLTDLMGYFIMRYDLNGNYISAQKIPFWAEGVTPIQNKGVVLYANYRNNSKYLKKEYNIIYLDSLNQIQYTYFPYNSSLIGRTRFITPSGGVSYTYNDQSYFFNPFNDTVYQLAPTGLVVKYIFDLGERKFDQSYFSKNQDELNSYVKKGEYYNIMDVLENDDWVCFSLTCFSKFESWHGFYSKKSGEIINAEFYYNKNQNFIPNNLATFNSWFIAELPIDYLLHSKDQNKTESPEGMAKKELNSLLQTLTEDDNPVLMMYKLKDC